MQKSLRAAESTRVMGTNAKMNNNFFSRNISDLQTNTARMPASEVDYNQPMVIEKYKKQAGKPMFEQVQTPSIKNMSQAPLAKAEHVKKITANEKLLHMTQLDRRSNDVGVKIKPIDAMNRTLQGSPSAHQPVSVSK